MNTSNSYHDGDRQERCGASGVFANPHDVMADRTLGVEAKRAILASWASDACSVENQPNLRRIAGGALLQLDEILSALKMLEGRADRREEVTPHPKACLSVEQRRDRSLSDWLRNTFHKHDDNDDDPPPCPAAAMPRPAPLRATHAFGSFANSTTPQPSIDFGRSARKIHAVAMPRGRRPCITQTGSAAA